MTPEFTDPCAIMDTGRIFSRGGRNNGFVQGGTMGFFQGAKVVKFYVTHLKLRKQPSYLKIQQENNNFQNPGRAKVSLARPPLRSHVCNAVSTSCSLRYEHNEVVHPVLFEKDGPRAKKVCSGSPTLFY